MWKKVYLTLLVVGVLAAGFFAYYGWSWLQSIGDPRAAWEAYNYHRRAGVYFTISWTAVLVIVANVVLWNTRNAWAIWVSHLYFVVFALLFLVLLHVLAIRFCTENNVCQDPSRFIGVLLAVFGSLALAGVLFVDQYVILRLQQKMHGKVEPTAYDVDEKENSRPDEAES